MKTANKKPVEKESTSKLTNPHEKHEIKTDFPLSEKDEEKQAEEKMRKTGRKIL